MLLDHGASVDARDAQGRTPLFWAASRGLESIATVLLQAGASCKARDKARRTPFDMAVQCGHA
jgi:ankyrin repeat protein